MLAKIISAELYNPKVELDIDVPTGKIHAFRVLINVCFTAYPDLT
jgi:hypothetical protein